MKVLLVLVFFIYISSGKCSSFNRTNKQLRPKIVDHWIIQKVDNFDPNNGATWKMRYLVNDMYFKAGGPIFILIGGEWTIDERGIQEGHLITDIAKEMSGLLFYTEHRYYGESIPDLENVQYLSSDQALADLKNFIITMKETRPVLRDSKVFVVGCSYAGTLAAWMRQMHSDVVDGAWASSAPLVAKSDFREYYQAVEKSIELVGGRKCMENIKKKYNQETAQGKGDMRHELARLAQQGTRDGIENFCSSVVSLRRRFGNDSIPWEKVINEIIGESYRDYRKPSNPYDFLGTPWHFQTCSEFGWYQTPDPNNEIFVEGLPKVEDSFNYCKTWFPRYGFNAETIEENIRKTNEKHLGLNLTTTKVYYYHGQLDPWRMVGLQESPNEDMPVTVVPFAAHCHDLHTGFTKPDELKQSRLRATELVKKWLQ